MPSSIFFRFARVILSHITDETMCLSVVEDMEYRFSQDLKEKGRLKADLNRIFQFIIINKE